ncbi:PIN-like domain-containing protein [Lacticaseibacillus paracasei]|uniref:PIN-like domain-containing protein n=1 Tax=Lacticaseibacillus paracasei TaxID=1597 RepID=UPI0031D13DCA
MEDFKHDYIHSQRKDEVYIFDTSCLLDYVHENTDRAKQFVDILKNMGKHNEIRYSHQVLKEFEFHSKQPNPKAKKGFTYIKNKKAIIKELVKNINALVKTHKEPTNPDSCKDKDNLSALEQASDELNSAYKKLNNCFNGAMPSNYGNNEFLIDYLHENLPMLESYSDIIEKYEWINEGFVRVSHNIPPAYQDSYNKRFPYIRGKASSEKRAITRSVDVDESIRYLGDFFIWKEILKSLKQGNSLWQKHVTFITNDEKADWFIKEKVPVETSRNRNNVTKNIRPELKEEFRKTAEKNGNNADIEFLTLKEWESIIEQSNIQKILDAILDLTKHEKELNTLIDSWQLKDKVSDELRDRAQLEIYDDSSYADGMYMDDVDIDDFNDLDVSIENVYTINGKFYISGVASIEANASIHAYYNEDDIGTRADEIFNYNVSGTFNFRVEFSIDEKSVLSQDNDYYHSEIMDQILTCDANTEVEDPDITISPDIS